jgi:transposase
VDGAPGRKRAFKGAAGRAGGRPGGAAARLAGHPEGAEPAQPVSDEIYRGKRRHPRPQLARARHEAAAEAEVARRRANDEPVRALRARGAGIMEIARTVGISKMTACTYLREGPPQRKRHGIHGKQRVLEPYESYLLRRWDEGGRLATVLWRELQTQGFAHSLTDVQRFLAELRRQGPPPTGRPRTALTKPPGPPPRQVAAIVLRRPAKRTEEQGAYLKLAAAEDAAISAAVDRAEDFLVMLRRREGERLPIWLERAAASGIAALTRFAGKLRTDLAAVQAGLTLRQSDGQTEGHVNRLKPLKRQGYGRAKVDRLRKRVLAHG